MSDQEENDRKEALMSFTYDIGERIEHGSMKTNSLFSSARIHKVPQDLLKLNPSAYTPRIIAIGPLHWDDPNLSKTMQNVKMYYANHLFSRITEGIEDVAKRKQINTELLQQCVEKMEQLVERAKECYAEEIKVKHDNVMAEMMLIDGCFILELLCCYHDTKTKDAGKSTTNGGDSGNSKALSSSAPQPVNEGEDGSSGVGGCIYSFCKRHNLNLLSQASSSSVPQPNNKGEDRSSGGGEQRKDPISDNILTANIVKHDLLLLENQIPFFVLKELFKLTVDNITDDKIPGGTKLSLTEYVVSYFGNIISPEIENSGSKMKTSSRSQSDCAIWVCGSPNECEQRKKVSWKDKDYYHILHLLHDYYVPAGDQGAHSAGGCSPWRCTIPGCCSPCRCTVACCCCSPWRCTIGCKTTPKDFTELEIRAKDLDYAGVKFVRVDIEGNNLFDVKFEERNGLYWWFRRSRFEIPTLHIHDPTEPFLRNLIAFEQCCPEKEIKMIFTSYAKFMDLLINDEEDVRVLRKAKVIRNHLGEDKDVSKLFNDLCKGVVLRDFHFNGNCQDAYKYSNHWWPKCMAYLRRTYFASPWAFIGFCLALIAFGIQIKSFVYSFLD